MNYIRVHITVNSLSILTPVGTNTYGLTARMYNSSGGVLSDPNIPATYSGTVVTTNPSFIFLIPITDGNYTVNDIFIKISETTNPGCCFAYAQTGIVNTFDCADFDVDSNFALCNGVVGITIADATEPLDIKVTLLGDTVDRFLDRSGFLILITPLVGTAATYTMTTTDAHGCVSVNNFTTTCLTPNFSFEYQSNPTCAGSTLLNGSIRIFNPVNVTRYQICNGTDIMDCLTDCTMSDGTINSSGDTIITIPAPAQGQTRVDTIRFYNGPACDNYTDYNIQQTSPYCDVVAPTCPPDGSWTLNSSGKYYKLFSSDPTASPSGYTILSKKSEYYAVDGTRIYDPNLTTFTDLTTPVLWRATTATNGPMNRCSLWTNKEDGDFPNNYLPLNMWLGFSHCLTGLTVGKTYHVGLEADNHFRLLVDSEVIMQNIGIDTHFRKWKIIPVVAKKSTILISMEGRNADRVAGFGCEIYDNTKSQIVAATVIGDLNIIFSSASKIGGLFDTGGLSGGVQYGFACPSGFTYNPCTGDCEQVQYCTP